MSDLDRLRILKHKIQEDIDALDEQAFLLEGKISNINEKISELSKIE